MGHRRRHIWARSFSATKNKKITTKALKEKILPHLYDNAGPDSLLIINLPFLMRTRMPRKVGCLDNRHFRQNCRFFVFEKIFQIRYFSWILIRTDNGCNTKKWHSARQKINCTSWYLYYVKRKWDFSPAFCGMQWLCGTKVPLPTNITKYFLPNP